MKFVKPSPKDRKNELFSAYLSSVHDTPLFMEWYACFEDKFFLFLSISAGRVDPIPEIDELNKLKNEIDVYYDKEDKTEEEVGELHDKSTTEVETICDRVERRLDLSDIELGTIYQRSFREFLNKV